MSNALLMGATRLALQLAHTPDPNIPTLYVAARLVVGKVKDLRPEGEGLTYFADLLSGLSTINVQIALTIEALKWDQVYNLAIRLLEEAPEVAPMYIPSDGRLEILAILLLLAAANYPVTPASAADMNWLNSKLTEIAVSLS